MRHIISGRVCLLGAFALFLAAMPANAQDAAPCPPGSDCITGLTAADLLAAANRLIEAGRTAEAAAILGDLRRLTPEEETERAFLRGMIALQDKDYAQAADRFRDILAAQPDLQRVRLELARALFLAHHDSAADYHFRLVLADRPPPGVAVTINRFLAAIRERRVISFSLELGLVPDSNANAAPDDDRVELYGLPFTLSKDARETGGLGVSMSGRLLMRPRLSSHVRLFSVLSGYHSEFFGGDFDDTIATAELGPEVETSKGTVIPSAIYFHRWFGGRAYNDGLGLRLRWQKDVSHTWSLQADAQWRHIDNKINDGLDGPFYLAGLSAQQRLDGKSYLNYQAILRRQGTRDAAYAYTEPGVTLGYGREFPLGITTYLSMEAAPSFYDGLIAAFGKVRQDWRLSGGLTLVKRDWSYLGFAPVIRLSYTRNLSNIDFYEYKRLRGEFTVTRTF
jgi:hypothetical protein